MGQWGKGERGRRGESFGFVGVGGNCDGDGVDEAAGRTFRFE